MIARGFKPVGWVAGVAAAALCCYMLSLNVAAERAELASVERQIILAKRDIRALQTELGTRGRLQQLEHWNAEVLALSAPASDQFLKNAFTLASYYAPEKDFDEEIARVRLASADSTQPATRPAVAREFTPTPSELDHGLVRRASLVIGEATPFVPANEASAKRTAPAASKPATAPSKAVKKAEVKLAATKPVPAKTVAAKPAQASAESGSFLDESLAREILAASKAENAGGAGGR